MKKKTTDTAFDPTKRSRLWMDIEKFMGEDLKQELSELELSIEVIEKIAKNKEVESEVFDKVFKTLKLRTTDFN